MLCGLALLLDAFLQDPNALWWHLGAQWGTLGSPRRPRGIPGAPRVDFDVSGVLLGMAWEPQGHPLRHLSPLERAPKVCQGMQKGRKSEQSVLNENVKKQTIKQLKLNGHGAQGRPCVGQVT